MKEKPKTMAENKQQKRLLMPLVFVAVAVFGGLGFAVGFAVAYHVVPSPDPTSNPQIEEYVTAVTVQIASGNALTQCRAQLDQLTWDCSDVLVRNPDAVSGIYGIYPSRQYHLVHCDLDKQSGGWTVIQRRQDGSIDFSRTYREYSEGFRDPSGEFWIGNHLLHNMTSSRKYILRVDLEDFEGNTRYALYSQFAVGSEEDGFRLTVGGYSGTAGDSFGDIEDRGGFHSGQRFSAKDRDQDSHRRRHCAQVYEGAWWFNKCFRSHLNGKYIDGGLTHDAFGIIWYAWRGFDYSLKRTKMKIKPHQ